jgi:6-phosphogluconate dehydrogenase (decarboxylating)
MVPAASVDATLDEIVPLLARDDVVVGGNSYYVDDIRRSRTLANDGVTAWRRRSRLSAGQLVRLRRGLK